MSRWTMRRLSIQVQDPDGAVMTLTAQPSEREPGIYEASYVPAKRGAYRANVTVTDADGSAVGTCDSGWTADPAARGIRIARAPTRYVSTLGTTNGWRDGCSGSTVRFRRRSAQPQECRDPTVDLSLLAPVVGVLTGTRLPYR